MADEKQGDKGHLHKGMIGTDGALVMTPSKPVKGGAHVKTPPPPTGGKSTPTEN